MFDGRDCYHNRTAWRSLLRGSSQRAGLAGIRSFTSPSGTSIHGPSRNGVKCPQSSQSNSLSPYFYTSWITEYFIFFRSIRGIKDILGEKILFLPPLRIISIPRVYTARHALGNCLNEVLLTSQSQLVKTWEVFEDHLQSAKQNTLSLTVTLLSSSTNERNSDGGGALPVCTRESQRAAVFESSQ